MNLKIDATFILAGAFLQNIWFRKCWNLKHVILATEVNTRLHVC
jgi:hypothetical protein